MDTQNHDLQQQKTETAAEKSVRYMTDEERREWSGISEWEDPLFKERPADDKNEMFGLASLLSGIAALLSSCIMISAVLFGIAAIICGIISKKKLETTDRLSTAGIIMGCCSIGIAVVVLLIKLYFKHAAPGILSTIPTLTE